MDNDILLSVHKPARYIGLEWNLPKKDFRKADIRFALSFPDLYEIGMSNLGLRIIYGLLNSLPDVSCERVFAPADDMRQILQASASGIFSLESHSRLSEFDILGFSLGSELDYTNVLNILELGGIPLESSLRGKDRPLVIGGGPCALNPEPMHEFFDMFIIGEAEDVVLQLLNIYRANKERFRSGELSKEELFFLFSQIEGVYVPSLYEVSYDASGKITEFKPKVNGVPAAIKKRFVKDLNASFFPVEWLVPYIQVTHDRISLEIMRGCPNKCRFCQAKSQYYPLRNREVKDLLELASQTYKCTGYEEISLAGLSVSDYAKLGELLKSLLDLFKDKTVSFSLPSLKAKEMVGEASALIATVKKTGLTFAPEAGSERLRRMLDKDFREDEFFRAITEAYSSGYQHIKLYFMIGLPYEEEGDLQAIIEFSRRVSELKRQVKNSPAQVNISINTLIPKPHTPFQWFGMEDTEGVRKKQAYLRQNLKNKRLDLNFHHRDMSFLEGILSRGDRRLSQVILRAYKKGARFDAWADHFRIDTWMDAFSESGIDPVFYLEEKTIDELLPWDFIDVGISKDYFISEFNKLVAIK